MRQTCAGLFALAAACTATPVESESNTPPATEVSRPVPPSPALIAEAPPPEESPSPAPTLSVVLEAHGTLTRIGDRPFFGPYDAGYRRLPAVAFGDSGDIEERITLPRRDGTFAVGGHWPSPLFALGAWGDRGAPDDPFVLVRFGETWKEARHAGAGYAAMPLAFPWRGQSLLAVGNPGLEDFRPPRMGVIAGTPRAPKLAPVLASLKCRPSPAAPTQIAAMAVDIDGPVALVLHCGNGKRWLVYWDEDDSPAETRPLVDQHPVHGPGSVQPALGPAGTVLFADLDGDVLRVDQRVAGQWQTASLTDVGSPVQVAVTPDAAWVLTTEALHEQTDEGWVSVDVPGEGAFRRFAGLETGFPWIARGTRQLWWRSERGAWVQVPLPDSPFENAPYAAITEMIAFGPRDLWLEARLPREKYGYQNRHARAVLTTRPAPAPKLAACGGAKGTHCAYVKWPAVDPACSKQLALVIDRKTGAASGHYRPLRKALKASPLPGTPPTFIKVELGHLELLGAWVESYEQGLALLERAPWKRPAYERPVCGDEASLARSEIVLGDEVDVMSPPGP